MTIDPTVLRQDAPAVWTELKQRLFDDQSPDSDGLMEKWCESHTPLEAFLEWQEWHGFLGWDRKIRSALWELISSDDEYLATTDQSRETWLKMLLGAS